MSAFKEFYSGLDILNLILFWGTIIVIILIIIFLTLYFSRRKKYAFINDDVDNSFDDVDIEKKDDNIPVQVYNEDVESKKENIYNNDTSKKEELDNLDVSPILKENAQLELDINPKENVIKEKKNENMSLFDDFVPKRDVSDNRAYQKNVFREMNARNQTSPIGISYENHTDSIEEYQDSLSANDKYLEDVYSSLEKASVPDRVELTDYEKRQEEDAVISYTELLKKKDNIEFDPEEDAVISYEELLDRKNRLYNIREEEEDKEFLSELKKFRRDL